MSDERRHYIVMSEDQFVQLADMVGDRISRHMDAMPDKIVHSMKREFFVHVGRSVVQKGLAVIGMGAVGVSLFVQYKIWPFNK